MNLTLALILPRITPLRAHAVATVAVVVTLESALVGAAVGIMGERWVGFLYLLPVFTALIPASLRRRVPLAFAVWASAWCGYATAAVPATTLLWSAILFSVFGAGLAIAIGHLAWHALRVALVSRHRLAEQALSLQAKVDEQTASLRLVLEQVETAREDERTAMARELHDELGQELSALRITLALGQV